MATTTGTVTTVNSGTGIVGGPITGNGTLSVDVGTSASKILQLNASAQIPAVDGFLVTNVNAAKISGKAVSGAAPTANQLLTYNSTTAQWEAQTSAAANAFLNGGNTFGAQVLLVIKMRFPKLNHQQLYTHDNRLYWECRYRDDDSYKPLTVTLADALTNTVSYPITINHTTSGQLQITLERYQSSAPKQFRYAS